MIRIIPKTLWLPQEKPTVVIWLKRGLENQVTQFVTIEVLKLDGI